MTLALKPVPTDRTETEQTAHRLFMSGHSPEEIAEAFNAAALPVEWSSPIPACRRPFGLVLARR